MPAHKYTRGSYEKATSRMAWHRNHTTNCELASKPKSEAAKIKPPHKNQRWTGFLLKVRANKIIWIAVCTGYFTFLSSLTEGAQGSHLIFGISTVKHY